MLYDVRLECRGSVPDVRSGQVHTGSHGTLRLSWAFMHPRHNAGSVSSVRVPSHPRQHCKHRCMLRPFVEGVLCSA